MLISMSNRYSRVRSSAGLEHARHRAIAPAEATAAAAMGENDKAGGALRNAQIAIYGNQPDVNAYRLMCRLGMALTHQTREAQTPSEVAENLRQAEGDQDLPM